MRTVLMLAGTLEQLPPDYPLIDEVAELGGAELAQHTSPSSWAELTQHGWAQLGPLVRRASPPRPHRDPARARRSDHPPAVAVRRRGRRGARTPAQPGGPDLLSLGVGLIAVLMLTTEAGPVLAGTSIRLREVLGWLGLFAGTVLLLRVLVEVLRPPPRDGLRA